MTAHPLWISTQIACKKVANEQDIPILLANRVMARPPGSVVDVHCASAIACLLAHFIVLGDKTLSTRAVPTFFPL